MILAPTGVASVNVNGTKIHSALGLPCRGKFFPLDSNTLAALRNKYAEVELIILDEISMVYKKVFYQILRRLIEIFNLPNLSFAGRPKLVVGDFHQLSPVLSTPVYASSLDKDHPESYIANDLWRLFSFAEFTEVMLQRVDRHFIEILNKVRVGNVDNEVERTLKSRIICSSDLHYPKYPFHVLSENVSVFSHNKVMLDQINGMPITIDAIDSIQTDCGFSDSQIMAARNRRISQTGGLSKTLALKLESKIMLTTNTDITDRLINGQIGVIKYFKFLGDRVDIIYIKFDNINAGKRLIQTDNLSRHNSWVHIKRTGTHINIGNSYISA